MDWKLFTNFSKISGAGNAGKAASHICYITRPRECSFFISDTSTDNSEETRLHLRKDWQAIEMSEIAKRHDARLQSRLIVALPNEFSDEQIRKLYIDVVKPTFGELPHVFAVHNGKKGEAENRHFHLAWNDRSKATGKKNRTLITRDFAEGFRKKISDWIETYSQRIITKNEQKRRRIGRIAYRKLERGFDFAPNDKAMEDFGLQEHLHRVPATLQALKLQVVAAAAEIKQLEKLLQPLEKISMDMKKKVGTRNVPTNSIRRRR